MREVWKAWVMGRGGDKRQKTTKKSKVFKKRKIEKEMEITWRCISMEVEGRE